jgi:hypothetical protein
MRIGLPLMGEWQATRRRTKPKAGEASIAEKGQKRMNTKVKELSANARAMASSVKGLALIIVVIVVLFSDAAFLFLFWNAFPPGILRLFSIVGAFATSLSVIGLYVGKSKWFRPGAQIVCAWAFAFVEILVSIANVIVSVQVARGQDLGLLSYWLLVAPATPFVAMIGWFLITWFDPERDRVHRRMEMEDRVHEAELEFEEATRMAQLQVKQRYLQAGEGYLQEELDSPEIQRQIHQAASNTMSSVLSQVTGQYISARRIVPSLDQRTPREYPRETNVPLDTGEIKIIGGNGKSDPLV